MLPSVEFQEIKCMHSFMNVLSLLLSIKFCYNLKDYEYGIYSTDRTQPNTKAHRESGLGVSCGSASSPLSKNCVCFGSALSPLLEAPFVHSCVKRTPTLLLPPTSPAPCIFPNTLSSWFIM